jgi:hypothetical protein
VSAVDTAQTLRDTYEVGKTARADVRRLEELLRVARAADQAAHDAYYAAHDEHMRAVLGTDVPVPPSAFSPFEEGAAMR